ncbi:Ku protein [Alkalihalobacillus trypoxylicola]|uniref:Non-homologous end joining protein Ku n=1 Tax=Alkalihalobacillus trypoxylicola TaxID=519424 RepID=A0A162FC07_9BACI|nr:Ku protein [Alkalihalobacillus trypoxylicola]KYG35251.1 Ku protein [Alkalihalobacillus trypoxylicola]
MHTIWKGSINFGLVNIPIKLHAATEDKGIKLRNLHHKCHTPIKYEKVCPQCEEEISNEDMIKGYEYISGKYVILSGDELEPLKDDQRDKVIDVLDFVQLDEIDPIYYDKTYFMSANEGGAKSYSLFREAIKESNKIAIAKVMIRTKENLAVLRVYNDVLIMETLHYPDEVRGTEEVLSPQDVKVTDKEKKAANMLIEQLTTTFEPTNYVDRYRLQLEELIQTKLQKEKDITAPTTGKDITDLMSALQQSIDEAKESKKKETTKRKRTKKASSS